MVLILRELSRLNKIHDRERMNIHILSLALPDEFGRQKSRIQWGDNNTKLIHMTVMSRRKKNVISKLMNDDGNWVEDQEI